MTRSADNKTPSTFNILKVLEFIPLAPELIKVFYKRRTPSLKVSCFGLDFINPVGVAAGVDRLGEYFYLMDNFGPSFIEIGPLRDVRKAIKNLQDHAPETLIFANLSNSDDIERSFSLIYDFVDAIVLNVSDNTTVSTVIDRLVTLRRYSDNYRPIIFKTAPGMSREHLEESVHYILLNGLDGIMVPAQNVREAIEISEGLVPVIAVGEFTQMGDVRKALDDGASMIAVKNSPQHYSPAFVKKVLKYLTKMDKQ